MRKNEENKDVEKNEDSERDRVRRKGKRRRVFATLGVACLAGAVLWLFVVFGNNVVDYLEAEKEGNDEVREEYQLSVVIFDENTGKNSKSEKAEISERVKEYVAQFESDLKDLGYEVEKAVLPAGMIREVDIYVKGKKTYFKTNLDRGTAVEAEDLVRSLKYLQANELEPGYVDIRVEGKAFYK